MKTNKTLLILSAFAALSLAACNQQEIESILSEISFPDMTSEVSSEASAEQQTPEN